MNLRQNGLHEYLHTLAQTKILLLSIGGRQCKAHIDAYRSGKKSSKHAVIMSKGRQRDLWMAITYRKSEAEVLLNFPSSVFGLNIFGE